MINRSRVQFLPCALLMSPSSMYRPKFSTSWRSLEGDRRVWRRTGNVSRAPWVCITGWKAREETGNLWAPKSLQPADFSLLSLVLNAALVHWSEDEMHDFYYANSFCFTLKAFRTTDWLRWTGIRLMNVDKMSRLCHLRTGYVSAPLTWHFHAHRSL